MSKPPGLQCLPGSLFLQRTVLGILKEHLSTGHSSTAHSTATDPATTSATTSQQPPEPEGTATAGASSNDNGNDSDRAGTSAAASTSGSTPGAAAAPGTFTVPAPVHRLGRGTSGLLLCARSDIAKRVLAEYMTHATVSVIEVPGQGDSGQGQGQEQESRRRHHQHQRKTEWRPTAEQLQQGMRKFYRALVQGIVKEDEVGWCHGAWCGSVVV